MAYPFLPEINNWYWSTFAEAVKADADYFGRNEFPHFDFAYGALTPQTRARLIAFSDAWWMHLHRAKDATVGMARARGDLHLAIVSGEQGLALGPLSKEAIPRIVRVNDAILKKFKARDQMELAERVEQEYTAAVVKVIWDIAGADQR